jgi:N-acyl-D-aspartate/D-glutamate deacylase
VIDRGLMPLEQGVKKVTADVARAIGLPDRGVIALGMAADIAVFDLGELDALRKEQTFDLPGGGMRWIQRARGVRHVLVNGVQTIRDGRETGDLPGRVLRSTDYR